MELWAVVSSTVVEQPRPVVLPAGELERIGGIGADLGGFPKRLIGVLLCHCASSIRKGYGTPQTIRQEVLAPELVGTNKVLIHSQAGQQVGRLPTAGCCGSAQIEIWLLSTEALEFCCSWGLGAGGPNFR
jgi:hypothetical protein